MAKVLLIPDGPENLKQYFPNIDWADIKDYYVQVIDTDSNTIATTPVNKNCNCCNEGIKIRWLNRLGTFDSLIFLKPIVTGKSESVSYKRGLSYPLQKTDTGIERFDVRSNDTYVARRFCVEQEMPWIQECQDSVKAFIEWPGGQEQNPDYIPIVIEDSEVIKVKNANDYRYEFILTFKLANEYFNIRN